MNKEDQVLGGFRELVNKMEWLNKCKMEDSLRGYTPSEVHCIEYIGKNEDSNVTKLAEAFFMTRSAMSKTAKRLMEKGMDKKALLFGLMSVFLCGIGFGDSVFGPSFNGMVSKSADSSEQGRIQGGRHSYPVRVCTCRTVDDRRNSSVLAVEDFIRAVSQIVFSLQDHRPVPAP